ncbi:hypothetical protein ACVI1K_003254 [Bradyrhizobium sp. USDA 4508]|nr:hypothetical protein [Bradyrhizobium sp. USDA 4541]
MDGRAERACVRNHAKQTPDFTPRGHVRVLQRFEQRRGAVAI